MYKPKYSIIIPTKNEEATIGKVLSSIPNKLRRHSEIIVADSSEDSTPEIAKLFNAKVIKINEGGKGRAVKEAIKISRGGILVFLDGDGTDPPSYIPILLEKLKDCNLVLGCRDLSKTKDKTTKILFMIYKHGFVNLFLRKFKKMGLDISDPLAGFRVIRKRDFNRLDIRSNNFEIEAEMNAKALALGYKINAVPIPIKLRDGGIFRSKLLLNPKELAKIIANGFS